MKNAAKLDLILSHSGSEEAQASGHSRSQVGKDITAKVAFAEENLIIRHNNNLTLALR